MPPGRPEISPQPVCRRGLHDGLTPKGLTLQQAQHLTGMKNLALWKRAVAEAWVQLLVSSVVLIGFGWLFVWLMSLIKVGAWTTLLSLLPDFVHPLFGVPLADLATPAGRLSFLYVHVVTLLVCLGWVIGRGSDLVSGRIARGTMELLITLPVRRVTVLAIPSVISTVGSAVLAVSVWLGSWVGLKTVDLGGKVELARFWPGVVNLFAMVFCLGGVTALLSSWDRDRWRTIWLAGGYFVLSAIIDMVSCLWKPAAWLSYATFLSAFDPQRLILIREGAWRVTLESSAALIGLGLLGYAAAAVIFSLRDVPVPR